MGVARRPGMQASNTMTRDVIVVPAALALAVAWKIMTRERIRHLPVVRAGALIGMLSDREVLARGTLGTDGRIEVPAHVTVGDAMTHTPLDTCERETPVADLICTMIEKKVDAVAVVHGLRLVGLVTSTDLLSLLLQREPRGATDPLPFEFHLIEDVPGPSAPAGLA